MKYIILLGGITAMYSSVLMVRTICKNWDAKRTSQRNFEFIILAISMFFSFHHVGEFIVLSMGSTLPIIINNAWIFCNLLVCVMPMFYIHYYHRCCNSPTSAS